MKKVIFGILMLLTIIISFSSNKLSLKAETDIKQYNYDNINISELVLSSSTTQTVIKNKMVNRKLDDQDSNGGLSSPTPETVLETIQCGNVKLPKALPSLTRFIVTMIEIAVPLILIIMGMLDFTKATAGSDEKEISKAKDKFIKRLIAGVVVFLSIVIVKFTVSLISIDNEANIIKCVDCLIKSESSCN